MVKRSVLSKAIVISLAVLMLLIVGCLDYKAYDSVTGEATNDELVNEIAQVENELTTAEATTSDDGSAESAEADVPVGDEVAAESEEVTETVTAEDSASDSAVEEVVDEVVEEVVLPDLEEEDLLKEEAVLEEEADIVRVKENEMIKLTAKVVDPDKDTVSYTFSNPLDKTGQWKTSYGDAGEYFTTITASDGVHKTERRLKIVVERVNVPPKIESLQSVVVKEGETVELTPKVSDPNKDKVMVTVSEPLKNGKFKTDHTSAGEYQIIVTASDGEMESEESFTLTVQDVNVLPEITGVADLKVKEGETVKLDPKITDLDEEEVSLTISEPIGNDGVWETGYTSHGDYVVTITADDGKDKVTKKINVSVVDVNMPPEIVEVVLVVN
ncbi:hypothetical protein HYX12_04425 [Candidatus Woesearchaeota archaeon]|nr:hypothetical protein [Candidatus Woesearchaeota archaeon]